MSSLFARSYEGRRGGRISRFAGVTCIVIAVLVDTLQAFLALAIGMAALTLVGVPLVAIAFVGALMLSVFSYLAFGFYFLFVARVRFLSGTRAMSRLGALFGSFVFELAPFFNGFPWFTAGVVHIVQTTWQEAAAEKQAAQRSLKDSGRSKDVRGVANDNAPLPRPTASTPAPAAKKEIPTPRKRAA